MLQRQVKTSMLSWADRVVLAALARLMPGGQLCQLRLIVSPRTVLRWLAAAAAARLILNAGKSPPGGGSARRRSAPVMAEITA